MHHISVSGIPCTVFDLIMACWSLYLCLLLKYQPLHVHCQKHILHFPGSPLPCLRLVAVCFTFCVGPIIYSYVLRHTTFVALA